MSKSTVAGRRAILRLTCTSCAPVPQAVLSLAGHGDEDTMNWGRMRVLTSYKLIRRLTELKPGEAPKKVKAEKGRL